MALVCSKSLACFSNRAQIYHSRLAATQHLRCQNRVHHFQIFPQLQSRPLFFGGSYCILFVAQLWQHKALIYSEAVGGACRARARRAITLTSNCRETQPRDGDHKSVSDEPRHSQLICIHPPAGLLSESISTGAETAAAAAAVGGCGRRWLGGDVQRVESGLMLSGFVSLHLTANRCI